MNAPTVTVVSLSEPEVYRRQLVRCRCGAWRADDVPPNRHAPRMAKVSGRLALINCVGEVLT